MCSAYRYGCGLSPLQEQRLPPAGDERFAFALSPPVKAIAKRSL
jgi:hypothetical protein